MNSGKSMTWEDFVKYAKDILSVSLEIKDKWVFKGCIDEVGQAYLAKECLVYVKEENGEINGDEDNADELEVELYDVSTVNGEHKQYIKCEFHILYSISYGVPVLYFNLWKANGNLLSIGELWEYVNDTLQPQIKESSWNMLTQQEHPILRRPFFQLHPCHTGNILQHPSANPLVTWLSTVAAAAPGLYIPLHYCKLTQYGK